MRDLFGSATSFDFGLCALQIRLVVFSLIYALWKFIFCFGLLVSLLTVDPKKLRDMVRDKNFESLSEFGGVKELALILETNVKNSINGCKAHLIHRQNVFGANKYQKPLPKRFLRFVFDAFKDTTILILLACAVLSLGFGFDNLSSNLRD